MKIAIVGAGFAGLVTAKTMRQLGLDVTVFDTTPDVGGVWSATRRYPGLTTQNNRSTYALSDFPMPSTYPEWPSGEQVQAYLQAYVEHFDLAASLRLETEVVTAELDEIAGSWTITTRSTAAESRPVETACFDHLVVCNGIFSDPLVPDYPGAAEFIAAGGRVCHASDLTELEDARDRRVLVVGYGKSACDVAGAVSGVAATTTVVARHLIWKMPKRLAGLNYKYLLLTRMGEALFPYIDRSGVERFMHGVGKSVGRSMLGSVQSLITRQLRLRELDLVPEGGLERIARSTVSLATDHFYDLVADGSIEVRKDSSITRLLVIDGTPSAELTGGEVVPADLIVCGTGFRQRVPFLPTTLQDRLTDERGNFELYRQIHPMTVPRLSFNGYNSSFFSPLSAEIAALWIVDLLGGALDLPTVEEQRAHITRRLAWMEARTEGKHARGTNIIPFSIHNIDEMLDDLGVQLSAPVRLRQWLLPVDPGSYRVAVTRVLSRHRELADRLRAGSRERASV